MCGMHWDPDSLSDGLERKETAASLAPSSAAAPRQTRPSLNALGAWGPRRAPVARGSGEPRRPSGARPWSAVPPHAPSALTEGGTFGGKPPKAAPTGDDTMPPSVSALMEGDTYMASTALAGGKRGENPRSPSMSALRRPAATRAGALPGSPAVCDDDPPDLGDTKAAGLLSAPWNQRLGPLRALGALPISGSVRAW